MANPATSTAIKTRTTANDVVLTPDDLAQDHIHYVIHKMSEIIPPNEYKKIKGGYLYGFCDPCRGPKREDGAYYKEMLRLAGGNKELVDWYEITDDVDFLEESDFITNQIMIGNPPYSIIDKWLEATIKKEPRVVSYLIGIHNLTPKRLQFMEDNGYRLISLKMTKVFRWYGMSCFPIWIKTELAEEKNIESVMDWDRKVWKHEDTSEEKKKKEMAKKKKEIEKLEKKIAALKKEAE